jgi:hypothetical protein
MVAQECPPSDHARMAPKLGGQPISVAQGCPPGPFLRGIIRIGARYAEKSCIWVGYGGSTMTYPLTSGE